jgi:hypothetical protein
MAMSAIMITVMIVMMTAMMGAAIWGVGQRWRRHRREHHHRDGTDG